MIDIKNFDSKLLKIYKKPYKNINIYCIGYITIISISDYNSINSVNSLYSIIDKNENKYLIFISADKNKVVLTKCTELWDRIKGLIDKIDDKPGEYGKDFIKIKFNSDDNLPLNKILKLYMLTVIVRSVFQEDNKYCT